MTAPQLLADALGLSRKTGAQRCFYCGGACDESFTAAEYVADSFTARDDVAAPASAFVCWGCVEALRSDVTSVPLIDGTTQVPKEGGTRLIQMRWFSWIITSEKAVAATPGHRELLKQVCLNPPAPPFAICIADGNKHQLYKTPVNLATGRISLNCEGVRVNYHPDDLRERMHLTLRLVAAGGKGINSLERFYDPRQDCSVVLQLSRQYTDAAAIYEQWRAVRLEPLTDLAIFLTPGKDDARDCLESATATAS